MTTKLVRADGRVCVQFVCRTCGRTLIVALDDIDGTFTCRRCGTKLTAPPVPCHHQPCAGVYRRCGGTIRKLSAAELQQAEAEAWAGVPDLPSAPTDTTHDDYGDIRGSITTYRCERCGATWSLRYGVAHGYDSGTAKCERVLCWICHRSPSVGELPEPDTLFNRRLTARYPYLWLDAFAVKVNRSYRSVTMTAVVVVGVTESGAREILAAHLRPAPDPDFWAATLSDLTGRGLRGVRLVVVAADQGVREAVSAALPTAALQRPRSDVVREVAAQVPPADRAQVRASLKTIFARLDQPAAGRELQRVAAALTPHLPAAGTALVATGEEALAYLAYPTAHRARLSSLDAFKPLHQRVLLLAQRDHVFVDEAAAQHALRSVAEVVHSEWQADGQYFSAASMKTLGRSHDAP